MSGGRARPAPRSAKGRAPRPRRRLVVSFAVSVALVLFLLVGVFPTQDWLAQRDEARARAERLEAIQAEQAELEERIVELQDPEEIESIAREEHGMTLPGEEAYRILPEPVPPVDLPDTWPFVGAEEWLNR